MLIIHSESDDAILAGWGYFQQWRKSRNALLLFDALGQVNFAERIWIAARGARDPLRREWQVLRRCVMTGLGRLRAPLIVARSPAETERALYGGGKRATLARTDQLNDLAVVTALSGSTLETAASTLAAWGKPRKKSYLKKRASQLGLTARKVRPAAVAVPKGNWHARSRETIRIVEIEPGRRRHRGSAY